MRFIICSVLILVLTACFNNSFSEELNEVTPDFSGDLVGIGYQVGGMTLIGINYEKRITRYFGLHFGAGFVGYNAGINIHLNKSVQSGSIAISYEDAGLGALDMVTVEYNSLWAFGKLKKHGIFYEFGVGFITQASDYAKDKIFKGNVPPATLSIGLGYGFRK